MDYQIYTDGSCLRNPEGPGGWAFVVLDGKGNEIVRRSGGEPSSTNNRMELTAALEALRYIHEAHPGAKRVRLMSDSQYVINGITDWIRGWKRRNWKTAGKDPVKNVDLWQALDAESGKIRVDWVWVRGHDGNEWNEVVDGLATAQSRQRDLAA